MKETGVKRPVYEALRRAQARRYNRLRAFRSAKFRMAGLQMENLPATPRWMLDLVGAQGEMLFCQMTGLAPEAYETFCEALRDVPSERYQWRSHTKAALDSWRLWLCEVAMSLVDPSVAERDVQAERLLVWLQKFVTEWELAQMVRQLPDPGEPASRDNVSMVLRIMEYHWAGLPI